MRSLVDDFNSIMKMEIGSRVESHGLCSLIGLTLIPGSTVFL